MVENGFLVVLDVLYFAGEWDRRGQNGCVLSAGDGQRKGLQVASLQCPLWGNQTNGHINPCNSLKPSLKVFWMSTLKC